METEKVISPTGEVVSHGEKAVNLPALQQSVGQTSSTAGAMTVVVIAPASTKTASRWVKRKLTI
jgi:hypothetical protein